MSPDAHITPHFRWPEVAYRKGERLWLPERGSRAACAIEWTCRLVLEPLREACAHPIRILPGGGYDPLYHPDTEERLTHRAKDGTRHHEGGALDFRIVDSAGRPWPGDWTLERAHRWLLWRIKALGIPGGIGVYRKSGNRFLHIDLRPTRARWSD